MRILMFSTDQNLLQFKSEVRQRLEDYSRVLGELEVVLYTDKNHPADFFKIGERVLVHPTNTHWRPAYFWRAFRIAGRIVKNRPVDIITAQDPFETGFAGWLLKIRFRLPLQIQIHTDIFSPYFYQESRLNKLRFFLARFLVNRADKLRVVSERIRQSLLLFNPRLESRIVLLPIFTDIKKIQSAKIKSDLRKIYPDYQFRILAASRLTKEKNLPLAIRALAKVAKRYPKTLLAIVGAGPELENLKSLVNNLRLENNVKFEPWTENPASYYKTADLFLLTSNYEGYGRTIVEALAAGLPIVMTDVGLAGELIIDDLDGKVVPVNDDRALAEAILQLMDSPEKLEEFKRNKQKLLESFPAKEEYLNRYKNSFNL